MKLESRISSESGIRKQVLDEIIGLAVKYGVKRVELFDPGPGEIIRGQVILTLPCVVGIFRVSVWT